MSIRVGKIGQLGRKGARSGDEGVGREAEERKIREGGE
jgi:hypothetical protein